MAKMEQFEKWRKTRPDLHIAVFAGNARDGWEAALKMIRGVGEESCGPEPNCYYEIMDAIDKELGNDD